jgi:hypothetical protein
LTFCQFWIIINNENKNNHQTGKNIMAVTIQTPQNFNSLVMKKLVDYDNDTFKLILCTDFTFDRDVDIEYADISVNELATGNGYINGGHTLSGGSVVVDDANNDARRAFDTLTLSASGGSIGPFKKMLIYNDTVANDPIVVCFTYSNTVTVEDGSDVDFSNVIPVFE